MTLGPRILISQGSKPGPAYVEAVTAAGGTPNMRRCPAYSPEYDGLVLSGGGDIDPARFGQEPAGSEESDRERDEAELALLHEFLSRAKPVLGICRGHQLINVGLGGTLIQHIGDRLCAFHRSDPDKGERKVHPVYSAEGSWYRSAYGQVFPVNSSHHQVVDGLGEGLFPVLWSESGLVEALEHRSMPVFSVQFHPERMTGAHLLPDAVDGGLIFRRFLSLF